MKLPVYLDYASTTPVDCRVAKIMMQYLTKDGIFGNASSRFHRYGWEAEEAVNVARDNIATFLGTYSDNIIFTSGATESNNLAIKGVAYAYKHRGKHIITSMTEHKTVLNVVYYLEKLGFCVTCLSPEKDGIICLNTLKKEIRDDTILFSLIHANNETGVVQNIEEFGNFCHSCGILFHVDATQSIGKIPINLNKLPIDLMSFNGHKVYGPKGIGGLFIRRDLKISVQPQIHGGGQEYGIRSGTLPVHQIVGMGEAYRILKQEMKNEVIRFRFLKNYLWKELQNITYVSVNGNLKKSIATILNVAFHNVNSELLMIELQDLAVSPSSACVSSSLESSYVLHSMGYCDDIVNSSIRFSLGRFTTLEEIKFALCKIKMAIIRLRKKTLYTK
ncbi:MAG: cysteine desulfurase [Candidatus Westeberhardia cardiocondylae]|nr:cysteine desulfurase [Candidatus Westeberhardia cardiocondylae]